MSIETGADWVYLAIRLLFIGAIYWFISMVVRTSLRELRALAATPEREAALEVADPGQLVLIDAGNASIKAGATWDFAPEMTIGRRPGNEVEIDDPFLSGQHAEILLEAGEWWIRDLGSTNGTLLNGAPVAALTALRPGDIVQFGNVRLQVLARTGSVARVSR